MVFEHAVRLQELAGADVRAKWFEHSGRVEAAAAVAGVNDDLHSFQRTLACADAVDDELLQKLAVRCHDIAWFRFKDKLAQPMGLHAGPRGLADLRDLGVFVSSVFEDLCNIFFIESAVPCEEFESVPVVRQMAGCDHDGSVTGELLKDGRHEHRRRGRVAEVVDFASVFSEAVHQSVEQTRSRGAGISADGQSHILRPLAQLVRKPDDKPDGDLLRLAFPQAQRFSGNACQGHASDVTSVLQFQVFLSHCGSPLLVYEKRCHF